MVEQGYQRFWPIFTIVVKTVKNWVDWLVVVVVGYFIDHNCSTDYRGLAMEWRRA